MYNLEPLYFSKTEIDIQINVLHGACDLFIGINYKCTMCTNRYRNVLQWSLKKFHFNKG